MDTIHSRAAPIPPSLISHWRTILFGFQGRICRQHYWLGNLAWYGLIFVLLMFSLLIEEFIFKKEIIRGEDNHRLIYALLWIPVAVLYIWSYVALQAKRWHDRDKTGFMILILLIPYVGPIWFFVECGCMRGTIGENSYGPDPT